MKLKITLVTIFTIIISTFTNAQEEVATAESIMNKAFAKAKVENKNVFIMFHASWCGWCKKMDASMNLESTKEMFESNYVIEHLVVKESKNNKHLENPGAAEILKENGGEKSGIPYWLIFDKDGILLADSKMLKDEMTLIGKGSNIGCPGTQPEVEAFLFKLRETSNLSEDELNIIATEFRKNSPN
jgi:thiol-disulfide isomerase/thioredoxin